MHERGIKEMFQVAGYSLIDGRKLYAVMDTSLAEPEYEILPEEDMITLVKFDMHLFDTNGEKIELKDGVLGGEIPFVDSSEPEETTYDFDDEDEGEWTDDYEEYEEDTEPDEDEDDGESWEDEYEDATFEDEDYEDSDWLDEYEEEEDEDASTVSKLYAYLTDDQIVVLKRYYLWYSQRLFTTAQKDPTLGMKDKNALRRKQQNLENLRNTGGMWHYAGFVDMGRKGEGYCTLGHPLRYMHLAWDVTYSDIETAFFGQDYDASFEDAIESNNCIVFGIKCISDFFEVSKDCTLALQRAQRESLKDMATMYQYYESGIQQEVMDTFTVLDELVKATRSADARGAMTGKDYKFLLKPELVAFYQQFRNAKMVPPKSMIQELRDCMLGWTSHKFTGTLNKPERNTYKRFLQALVRQKNLSDFFEQTDMAYTDGSYTSDFRTGFKNYVFTYLAYESCGWYKYNADTSKDEGGASKIVKSALANMYGGAVRTLFTDVGYSVDELKKLTEIAEFYSRFSRYNDKDYFVYFKKLHGGSDILAFSLFEWDAIEESGLEGYSSKELFDVVKFVRQTGSTLSSYTRWSQIDAVESNDRKIPLDMFYKVIVWAKSILERDLADFREWTKARYDKKEEENTMTESGVPTTVEEILEYLDKADMSALTGGTYDFSKKVYETVKLSGKSPSSKQLYHIKSLYKALSGREFETKVGVDKAELDDEKKAKLAEIVADPAKYGLTADDFGVKVAKTVIETGKASEKQTKWMNQLLEKYN